MSFSSFDYHAPQIGSVHLTPADTTVPTAFMGNAQNHCRVDQMLATSTDTVVRHLSVSLWDGGLNYVMGQVELPAGAGFNGVPPVDVLAGLGAAFAGGFLLSTDFTLQVGMATTLTAAKEVFVVGFGGSF